MPLELLRTRLVPGTLGAVSGVEAQVGGLTAESKDFNDQLKQRAPFVFAFVLVLGASWPDGGTGSILACIRQRERREEA